MTTLPQPPPGAPSPPPSEAAVNSRRKWNLLKGAGIVCILIVLAGLAAPMALSSRRSKDDTRAAANLRQIGLALSEFEQEYGEFPCCETIAAVRMKGGRTFNLGEKSSNEFFRQLLASEIVQSEAMFYANIEHARIPDNVISKGEALKKGECGFGYLANQHAGGNPSRPLVVTPLIPGTDRFDSKRFDGMALILRTDNSVIRVIINKAGNVIVNGRNILDSSHPIWDGKPPMLVWPE